MARSTIWIVAVNAKTASRWLIALRWILVAVGRGLVLDGGGDFDVVGCRCESGGGHDAGERDDARRAGISVTYSCVAVKAVYSRTVVVLKRYRLCVYTAFVLRFSSVYLLDTAE